MGVDSFNAAPADELRQALLACCDVPRWAQTLVERRPYRDRDAVLAGADRAAREFSRDEVDKALAAHPRIGERPRGDSAEAAYSRSEQSGVDGEVSTQNALLEGNKNYEERFGRVFLICARGLSAEQILSSLRQRLENTDTAEVAVVADELRKIALLRLAELIDPAEEQA